jgi:hypothetical protein
MHLVEAPTLTTTGVFAGAFGIVPSQLRNQSTFARLETRTARILGLVTPPLAETSAKVGWLSVPDANGLQNALVAPLTALTPVTNEPASAPTRSSSHVCCLIREPPFRFGVTRGPQVARLRLD